MSKLLSFTVGASCLSVAVAIALLVFNVLIYLRINDDETNTNKKHYVAPLPDPPKLPLPEQHIHNEPRPRAVSVMELAAVRENSTIFCSSYGDPDPMWQEPAQSLIDSIDQNADPCEDFFKFSCGEFIRTTGPQAVPSKRKQAQLEVYSAIKSALDSIKIDDESASITERITKKVFQSCVEHQRTPDHDYELQILRDMKNWFGGLPYLNHTLKDDLDVFGVIGALEQERALGTFMRAWVAPDNKHVVRNALYLSQPDLPMPREYYVDPQFYAQLEDRADMIRGLLAEFTLVIVENPQDHEEDVQRAALDVVKLETEIATASLPESEMRNYEQQYNPYTLEELKKTYPFIGWESYIANLLSSVQNGTELASSQIILTTPSYFAWLNTMAAGDYTNAFVNYMILHILFDEASFFRLNLPSIQGNGKYVPYALRRAEGFPSFDQQHYSTIDNGVAPDEAYCLHTLQVLMPYGPGYVYAKSLPNRNEMLTEIEENVDLITDNFVKMMRSVEWLTNTTMPRAIAKVRGMKRNIGWPKELFGDFEDFTEIDAYHEDDYASILNMDNFYVIAAALRKGYFNRQIARLITEPSDRHYFLYSPASVDAWYQQERNSITIPCGVWTYPLYRPSNWDVRKRMVIFADSSCSVVGLFGQNYPMSAKFASIGSFARELVRGFDEEGIQFGSAGELVGCSWKGCGWMDEQSKKNFRDMAQCVATQYSTNCCFHNVTEDAYCANGASMVNENIAELAGLQAAYNAYQQYIEDRQLNEKRLPGLEQFTPNQVFWIMFAHGLCAKESFLSVSEQLRIGLFPPNECRTNQVLRNIPAFAKDFGCVAGQKMVLTPEQRCEVWTSD